MTDPWVVAKPQRMAVRLTRLRSVHWSKSLSYSFVGPRSLDIEVEEELAWNLAVVRHVKGGVILADNVDRQEAFHHRSSPAR